LMGQIIYGNSKEALDVIEAQKKITENSKLSFLCFVLPRLAAFFPSFGVDKRLKGMTQLDKLVSDPQDGTVLNYMAKTSSESEGCLSTAEIKANALYLGKIGTIAIASALTSLVFVLVSYPELQAQIRQEINEVFGIAKVVAGAYDQFKQLQLLTKVIKETLRLYPPFPILPPRVARRHDKIGRFHIPPQTSVVIDVVGYNRNPEYWNDPDAFKPERFDHLPKGLLKEGSLAWGSGPRACISKNVGMMILRASLVSILSKYKITSSNAHVDDVHIVRAFGTLKASPGLAIQLTPP